LDPPSLQIDGSSFPPLRKPVTALSSQPPRGPPAQQSSVGRSSPPPLLPEVLPSLKQGGSHPRRSPLQEDDSPLPPSPGARAVSPQPAVLAAAKLSEGSGSPPGLVVQEAPAPIVPVIQSALDFTDHYRSHAIVCRFNGLWPRLADLHSWISSEWSPLLEEEGLVCPCAKGFFIVVFGSTEDRDQIFSSGPWFWGRSGLSMQPWTTAFDASTVCYSFSPSLGEAPKSASSLLGSGLSANHWECPWKVSQHKPRNKVCLHHIRPDLRGDGFLKRISSRNYPAK
jgi:hypothetical protein